MSSTTQDQKRKAVARWLLLGVFMLIIQILLGGITRLTGSGLSITEWKPILGAVPPMSEAAWQSAFEKYQQIAQYKYLNTHFTLSDFKHIYFWEWFHREWARIGLAVVFAVGFIYFLIKKYFDRWMINPFIILFVLGGLQGAVGWIMVKSGLNDTDLYVSHIRLAIHFMSALVLLCYTLWFALILMVPEEQRVQNKNFHGFTVAVIALLCVQLTYGSFMAGLKAATTAPTWPKINSEWVPDNFSTYGNQTFHGIGQFISHPLAVQFFHRTLAYIITGFIIAWFFIATKYIGGKQNTLLAKARKWPLILVLIQVLLGIFTVLNATPTIAGHFGGFEYLAEAHQLVAMFLLVSLIVNLYAVRSKNAL